MKVSTQLNEQLEALKRQRKVEKIRVLVELERVDIGRLNVLAEDFKVKYNAEIIHRVKVAPYFSILVDSDKVELIAEAPFVKKLWHIPKVHLLGEITLSESVKHITADRAKEAGYTGTGVKVAVVDSGIEKTHPLLVGKVIAEKNFTKEPDASDYLGHGTWCASCIAGNRWTSPVGLLEGVAPDALLINSKIFDSTGSCDEDTAMAGLEWACEQGAHISSNSWGSDFPYEPMRNLIISLKAAYGTIFVFAAGNSGPDYGTIAYPGGYPEVVGVGSIAVKSPDVNAIASFSSRGPNFQGDVKPDIMAPGGSESECIYAAFIGETVKCWHGTSMATPHIAGGLALLLGAGFSFNDAVARLYATAKDLVEVGKDNDSGFGTADFAAALGLPMLNPRTLNVSSSPSKLKFYVNGEVHLTPWSGQYSEGSYVVSVEAKVYVGGVPYKFSRWEDGSTSPKRTINLMVDLSLAAYYAEIPRYTLTVNSSPSGVQFVIQGVLKVTPYSELLETGSYTIVMPTRATVAGATYDFVRWEDGSTSLSRTVNLTSALVLTAYYEQVPVYLLSLDSVPSGVTILVDGVERVTPWIGKLLKGSHRLVTPSQITVGGVTIPFLRWEDGSTGAMRDIELTSAMSVTAYYQTVPTYSLTIKSQPITVPTTVNGKAVGTTPVSVNVSEGSHIISVPQEVTT